MNLMNIYEKLLEAIPPNQLALDEPMSVSYTHLDVYKRQPL